MQFSIFQESAFALISCRQLPSESVDSYAQRFRAALTRFEELVELVTPGRSPYQALSVIVFQRGLPPAIQCLQQLPGSLLVTSFREAVDLARRDEAFLTAYVEDPEILFYRNSARYSLVANLLLQQQQEEEQLSTSHNNGKIRARRGSRGSRRNKRRRRRGSRRPRCTYPRCLNPLGHTAETCLYRPRCEYPGCRKPHGHTIATCFQKERDEKSTTFRHVSKKRRKNRS